MSRNTTVIPQDGNYSSVRIWIHKKIQKWATEGLEPRLTFTKVRTKGGERNDLVMIQSHCTSIVEGTGSLIFNDDVTLDSSSRINWEVYRNILSVNLQRNASNLIGRNCNTTMAQIIVPTQQRTLSGRKKGAFRVAFSLEKL